MERASLVAHVRHRRRRTDNLASKDKKSKKSIILPNMPSDDDSKFRLIFFWREKEVDPIQKSELEWRISSIFNVARKEGKYEYYNP
ncbi:hypothetical protein IJT10_06900, partial [bacterium]|nr:hypothetical protein [bacterium]